MDEGDDYRPVIIDFGTGQTKAGFNNSDLPNSLFPSIVGRSRAHGIIPGMGHKDHYVGEEAIRKRGILVLRFPLEQGQVVYWDDMDKMLNHIFYQELRVAPEEHPTLMTETPFTDAKQRDKMTQVMFETFNVPLLYYANQQVLSLYATGHDTGIVVDCGDAMTHIVPIHNSKPIGNAMTKLVMGGRDLTDFIIRSRAAKGIQISSTSERAIINELREQWGYVAMDYNQEMERFKSDIKKCEKTYILPDDSTITIQEEQVSAPESLFHPSVMGLVSYGIHQLTYDSIKKTDVNIQNQLFGRVLLAGGNSLYQNIDKRLQKELESLVSSTTKVNVVAPLNRRYSSWIGGSILTSLSTFKNTCVSLEDYNEKGPDVSYSKCPLYV